VIIPDKKAFDNDTKIDLYLSYDGSLIFGELKNDVDNDLKYSKTVHVTAKMIPDVYNNMLIFILN